jgi:hypothetical protein
LLTADDFAKIIKALPSLPALLKEHQIFSISISPSEPEEDRIALYAFIRHHLPNSFDSFKISAINISLLKLFGQPISTELITVIDIKDFNDEAYKHLYQSKELYLVRSALANEALLATNEAITNFARNNFSVSLSTETKNTTDSITYLPERKEHANMLFNKPRIKRRKIESEKKFDPKEEGKKLNKKFKNK